MSKEINNKYGSQTKEIPENSPKNSPKNLLLMIDMFT